jgi:hypothetical protein
VRNRLNVVQQTHLKDVAFTSAWVFDVACATGLTVKAAVRFSGTLHLRQNGNNWAQAASAFQRRHRHPGQKPCWKKPTNSRPSATVV